MVIGELLGVRPEDQDDFQRWSLTAVSALTGGDVPAYEAARRAIEDCIETRSTPAAPPARRAPGPAEARSGRAPPCPPT